MMLRTSLSRQGPVLPASSARMHVVEIRHAHLTGQLAECTPDVAYGGEVTQHDHPCQRGVITVQNHLFEAYYLLSYSILE